MDWVSGLQAIFLGIVEGLTEFIPVSSTGHLILLVDLLGFEGPPGKTFEIIIQLGAILAICWLYRAKLWSVVKGLPRDRQAQLFTAKVSLAFLPAAVIGIMAHGFIKSVLFSPLVVASMLVIGGFLILIIERLPLKARTHSIDEMSLSLAVKVGFCQCLAMIPGTSRSGATIMGALLLGTDRKAATEFSFFLAIPTMLGATVYDLYKNWDALSMDNALIIGLGFIAAFLAAMTVVSRLIRFISNHGFAPFAYYRILIGGLMLLLLLSS
jgi:undecaprenyl-diphosphatase